MVIDKCSPLIYKTETLVLEEGYLGIMRLNVIIYTYSKSPLKI